MNVAFSGCNDKLAFHPSTWKPFSNRSLNFFKNNTFLYLIYILCIAGSALVSCYINFKHLTAFNFILLDDDTDNSGMYGIFSLSTQQADSTVCTDTTQLQM